ncbi:MAG TPA: helix-turn-helix domain-containing protein, partial [Candidatus Dorea faecipullorum]|nr:helix-turn-helix domain-containing protein [Candidatus Dorea faecipullorum]
MNIGEQISRLRKQKGLSQDEFANVLKVSRQTVSNWENEKSYPDLEMLVKISDYFEISVDEL